MASIDELIAQAAAGSPMPTGMGLIPEIVPGRTLLVDGDYLAYFCGGNREKETPVGTSRQFARERILRQKEMTGCEKICIHLTDNASDKGQRFAVATVKPYQGNRKPGTEKPLNWAFLRDWMQSGCDGLVKVKTWADREADDGATYHAMVLGPDLSVLTIADKDWRMSPGIHLDWTTWAVTHVPKGTWRIDGTDGHMHGDAFFWYQLLRGDQADHIPGLPFCVLQGKRKQLGEVTAKKYIDRVNNSTEAFTLVGALYRTAYPDEWQDRLAEQMCLLWMRRGSTAALDDCLDWLGPVVEKFMRPAFNRLEQRLAAAKQELALLCRS